MSSDGEGVQDPRVHNTYSDAQSLSDFVSGYADTYRRALNSVDSAALQKAVDHIANAAERGNRVYSIGNGGSAAISDHLCCDFTKGTDYEDHPTIVAHSLNANMALYSAISNDFGFEEVFERQVGYVANEGDVLVAISSSGNSENIVRAVNLAKTKGMVTIGMSGFAGGKLAEVSDVALYIDASNYGIVEDCHQSLMHIIAQVIARRRENAIAW